MLENRPYILREFLQKLSISYETVRHTVVDALYIRRFAAQLISKELHFFLNGIAK